MSDHKELVDAMVLLIAVMRRGEQNNPENAPLWSSLSNKLFDVVKLGPKRLREALLHCHSSDIADGSPEAKAEVLAVVREARRRVWESAFPVPANAQPVKRAPQTARQRLDEMFGPDSWVAVRRKTEGV